MAKMSKEQLNFLRERIRQAFDEKNKRYAAIFDNVLREFRVDSDPKVGDYGHWDFINDCQDIVHSHFQNQEEFVHIQAGRTPHMLVIVRKLLALLTLNNPYFVVEEAAPNDEAIAWILEGQLDALQSTMGMRQSARTVLLWALLSGVGIAKIGYASEFVYGEEAWADDIPRNALDVGDERLLPYGSMTELNPKVGPGRPSWIPVPTQDLAFDAEARDWDHIAQFYHQHFPRVIDVLHDDRYEGGVRAQITGDWPNNTSQEHQDYYGQCGEVFQQHVRRARLIEVSDVSSRQFAVITLDDGLDQPLRDWTDFSLNIERPFRRVELIEDPKSPYGIPYALTLLGPIRGVQQMRRTTADSIDRGGKTIYVGDSTGLDDNDIEKIEGSRDQSVVLVNLNGRDVNGLFRKMNFGGANPDVLRLQDVFEEDVRVSSVLSDSSRNATRGGKQTATEIQTRQSEQGIGVDFMRDIWEEFLEGSMGDICRLLLQFWPAKKVVKVAGNDPRTYFWHELERDRVLRDFTLKISAGSTRKVDKALRDRQMIDLIPRLLNIKQMADQEAVNALQGMPPSPIPAINLFQMVVEAFEPKWVGRLMRHKDPMTVLTRLRAQGATINPTLVSPELQAQLDAADRPPSLPMVGQGASEITNPSTPFEATAGVPAPANAQFGRNQQDTAAGQLGRALSEVGSNN